MTTDKVADKDYLPTQAFFHTVLRNVGLCITISLAVMTLNRYWRAKSVFITVVTWFIAVLALLLSMYINGVLLSEGAVSADYMQKWKGILYVLLVCQAFLLVSYGFIGKVVFTEVVIDRAARKTKRTKKTKAAQRRTKPTKRI